MRIFNFLFFSKIANKKSLLKNKIFFAVSKIEKCQPISNTHVFQSARHAVLDNLATFPHPLPRDLRLQPRLVRLFVGSHLPVKNLATGLWLYLFLFVYSRALSIQPKIPEIPVGSSNGTDHFGLVRPEYSGPALKVVHCDRSGHFGRSDRNVPFHLPKLLSPVPLFSILLTRPSSFQWKVKCCE